MLSCTSGLRTDGCWTTCVPIGVRGRELLGASSFGWAGLVEEAGLFVATAAAVGVSGLLTVVVGGVMVGCVAFGTAILGVDAASGFRAVRVPGVGCEVLASWDDVLDCGVPMGLAFGGAALALAVGGCGAPAGGLLPLPQRKMRVDIARGSPP